MSDTESSQVFHHATRSVSGIEESVRPTVSTSSVISNSARVLRNRKPVAASTPAFPVSAEKQADEEWTKVDSKTFFLPRKFALKPVAPRAKINMGSMALSSSSLNSRKDRGVNWPNSKYSKSSKNGTQITPEKENEGEVLTSEGVSTRSRSFLDSQNNFCESENPQRFANKLQVGDSRRDFRGVTFVKETIAA